MTDRTNAERQRRYIARLKERAAEPVTNAPTAEIVRLRKALRPELDGARWRPWPSWCCLCRAGCDDHELVLGPLPLFWIGHGIDGERTRAH